ncbi:MAG: Na+/H+ antiporter [Prevotella sp.]|nr:Na+/H+ antiporter [Prevotella sp.]
MVFHTIFTISLILVICLLTMLGRKIKVAYPILLVLAGLTLSFVPGVPRVEIEPELIFIIFLPPLLFEAASGASWKELWRWRRIIFSFAFPVVFVTACVVALITNAILPGFSIGLGFLLGGIVSPPDAVSAQAIMKFVKIPKRLSTILEGESLFNDASSLIIMRFALIAIGTGQFVWYHAVGGFLWMIVGGLLVGLAVAWVMIELHRYLPTDVNIDVVFTLIAPYIMYVVAEEVVASGVIAVVSGGLLLNNRSVLFQDSSSRLSASNVWHNFGFLLNGIVFLLIGLDLPEIVSGMDEGGVSLVTATGYGLLVTAVLILVRLACSYGALLVTMVMRNFIRVADPNYYGLRTPLILGWTGMRGVVSLAAALSIPLTVTGGMPFPERSMILYITFVVILVTLLLQGLTLPVIISHTRFPDFHDHLPVDTTEAIIRKGMADTSLRYLQANNQCKDVGSSRLLQNLVEHWERQLETDESMPLYASASHVYREVLEQQRLYLHRLNRENRNIDESIIRRFIHRIDLEEERLKHE